MATFALVHGAWHGAWCWEQLTPELEGRGHRVVTMDLPIDDSSATFEDYADVVCAAVAGVRNEDLVVVGHSLAGQTIPYAAARRPLRRLVYVCAIPPLPEHSLAQQMTEDKEMLNPDYMKGISEKDSAGRRSWTDRDVAIRHLFGDCDEVTASAAFARLRPQATYAYGIAFPMPTLPAVNSTYVVCSEDRIVNPEWSKRIAREWLDADVIELPGSHSPFLSRPTQLADVLSGLAAD
jgi:pimeloyl-ACP methyl ester carboxylesterase